MTSYRTFTQRSLASLAVGLFAIGTASCSAPVEETPADPESVVQSSQLATQAAAPEESPKEQSKAPSTKPQSAEPKPAEPVSAGTALAQLETIAIKGRAPKTGYEREQFGSAWTDVDGNFCDTRNDILTRDLTNITYNDDCEAATGLLADPFTGTTIQFVRGVGASSDVQIDHVVSLSNSWQTGAQQLAPNVREAFANDPLNLLAVDGPSNASKGDGDAATWLPPNKSFRCEYVALQTAVKAKYDLWMTQAEHDAIEGILMSKCPNQPVPAKGGVTVPIPIGEAPAPEQPIEEAPAPGGSDVSYENCTEVEAAGAAPIKAGDPGWDSDFDGDGDLVGCEG